VYFVTVVVFSFWSGLTQQSPQAWVGSLAYLPHGCKVIFICFFGYRAVPALFLAEYTGQLLEWPNTDMTYMYVGSITSILSVLIAAELIKWTQIASFKPSDIFLKVNFINYKFIVFVIILSALFNSIFTNLVLSQLNQIPINVGVIARFYVGDIIGSSIFILFAIIAFKLQTKLMLTQENK
ncbi:MAG: hypothetical protein EBW62_04605, partial [Proteobacteria bacterium]|nr:hypothetical protein [Pseudomonadota bacterium]